MSRTLPWRYGMEGTRPAVRLSARVRRHEAVLEARSSLEQFSGMSSFAPKRSRVGGTSPLSQQLSLAWQRIWTRGPVAWIARLRPRLGKRDHIQSTASSPLPALSASFFSLRRLPAHLGLLVLVSVLLFGGGFHGVLAQPVEGNQGSFVLSWQQLQRAGESGVLSAYASIPAVPVKIQRPNLTALESVPAGEEAVVPVRGDIIVYSVEEGDNLTLIADKFGLTIETLYWFNGLKSADLLQVGQELKIPPMDGLIHEVKEGDTLDGIADTYKVRMGNMIAFAANNLREPYNLEVGQNVFVPGASKPIPRPAVMARGRPSNVRLSAPPYAALPGGERFSWPAIGTVTDRFGWTGSRWHTGLDISAPWGTPIYSAAAGTVTYSGWRGTYGYCVEIDPGEGWVTRYGHMAQDPEVYVGQWVERSQLIGYIGCTGKCTGPHVHFEVYYQGAYCDPLDYLQ